MSPIEGFSPVDRPVSYLLQWTEKARIQLIEAVIEVEEQMIARASTARWCTTGKRMVNTRFEYKWSTVANLLPIEYRGKIWNEKKQMYYKYKCDRMFNSLLHAYRERVAGKSTQAARWGLSEPVLKLLKKREDLVRQRCSETAASSLRSEISTSVNASEDQKESQNVPDSSEGQLPSNRIEEADAWPLALTAEPESAQDCRNISDYGERGAGSHFNQDRRSDLDHHAVPDADSLLGCASANVSNWPDPSSSAHDYQNLEDVGMPFVCARVQTRAPFHIGKWDSNPKRRRPANHTQPPSFLRKCTTAKAWKKKRKLALLVDIYAKETDRNHIDQEEPVEKCNSGCFLRSASEDPVHQGNRVRSTPGSPSRSLSASSDQGNMVQTRLKVQARTQDRRRKRDTNLSTRRSGEQRNFTVMPLASKVPRF